MPRPTFNPHSLPQCAVVAAAAAAAEELLGVVPGSDPIDAFFDTMTHMVSPGSCQQLLSPFTASQLSVFRESAPRVYEHSASGGEISGGSPNAVAAGLAKLRISSGCSQRLRLKECIVSLPVRNGLSLLNGPKTMWPAVQVYDPESVIVRGVFAFVELDAAAGTDSAAKMRGRAVNRRYMALLLSKCGDVG